MRVTRTMLEAAIRADYDYLQRTGRTGPERYIPNEEYLRIIAQAVLNCIQPPPPPQSTSAPMQPPRVRRSVVTAKPPRPRA